MQCFRGSQSTPLNDAFRHSDSTHTDGKRKKSPGDAVVQVSHGSAAKQNLSATFGLAEFLSWLRVSDLVQSRRLRTQGAPFS